MSAAWEDWPAPSPAPAKSPDRGAAEFERAVQAGKAKRAELSPAKQRALEEMAKRERDEPRRKAEAAKLAKAKAAIAEAHRAASEAMTARTVQAPPQPGPEESRDPVIRALHEAAKLGAVGRLVVGPGPLSQLLNEFAALDYHARAGISAQAAVLVVDHDNPVTLGVSRRLPNAGDKYVRSDPPVAALDTSEGLKWLDRQLDDVRELPNIGAHLAVLVVIAGACVPEDLRGLSDLAAEKRAVIALVTGGAVRGWHPVSEVVE